AAAKRDSRIGAGAQPQGAADLETQDIAKARRLLLQHRAQFDPGIPSLTRQMVFPDRVATEVLTRTHYHEQITGRFQRSVGDEEFDRATAILEVDPHAKYDAAVAWSRNRREARVCLHPFEAEADWRDGRECLTQIIEDQAHEALDQRSFNRRVGSAFDAHWRG